MSYLSYSQRLKFFSNYKRFQSLFKFKKNNVSCHYANLREQHLIISNQSLTHKTMLTTAEPNVQKFLNYLIENNTNFVKSRGNILSELCNSKEIKLLLSERTQILENLYSLKELYSNDPEMKSFSKNEETLYKDQLNDIENKLLDSIMVNIGVDYHDKALLEITAGVGGQEAMLFTRDLYEMYKGYMNYLNIDYEILEEDRVETGGFRHVNLLITGNKAFESFKHEGGVHRVQRIPVTENSGRVHTSTASVAVLPAPTEIEINLKDTDLIVESKRASGPGGQHVNKTSTAIRIVHIPTGIAVTCQTQRSQIKNKKTAMLKLRTLLYEKEYTAQNNLTASLRRQQFGQKNRNEKIRTYNFHQNRVTDHRLKNGTINNIKEFMQGGEDLEAVRLKLQSDMQYTILLDLIMNERYIESNKS